MRCLNGEVDIGIFFLNFQFVVSLFLFEFRGVFTCIFSGFNLCIILGINIGFFSLHECLHCSRGEVGIVVEGFFRLGYLEVLDRFLIFCFRDFLVLQVHFELFELGIIEFLLSGQSVLLSDLESMFL